MRLASARGITVGLATTGPGAALTAAMNRLIGDRGLQARLVEGGRRRYEAEFTEAAVVASYKALFEKMLAKR